MFICMYACMHVWTRPIRIDRRGGEEAVITGRKTPCVQWDVCYYQLRGGEGLFVASCSVK